MLIVSPLHITPSFSNNVTMSPLCKILVALLTSLICGISFLVSSCMSASCTIPATYLIASGSLFISLDRTTISPFVTSEKS